MRKMDSSGLFDSSVRIKKEPIETWPIENDYNIIDKSPNVKFSHSTLQCNENQESALDDVKIELECKDVKVDMDLLAITKIENLSENSAMKINDDYQSVSRVKKEMNLSTNCEPKEKKEKVTKKFNHNQKLKNHIDAMHNGIKPSCNICGKMFTKRSSLKIHIDSIHNRVRHACDICQKKFTRKDSLKTHVDEVHNGVKHTCDTCQKTFTQKCTLKSHIDSVHSKITHACDTCGKTFIHKASFKRHIKSVHNKTTYSCDKCGKVFGQKKNLKAHVDVAHQSVA